MVNLNLQEPQLQNLFRLFGGGHHHHNDDKKKKEKKKKEEEEKKKKEEEDKKKKEEEEAEKKKQEEEAARKKKEEDDRKAAEAAKPPPPPPKEEKGTHLDTVVMDDGSKNHFESGLGDHLKVDHLEREGGAEVDCAPGVDCKPILQKTIHDNREYINGHPGDPENDKLKKGNDQSKTEIANSLVLLLLI